MESLGRGRKKIITGWQFLPERFFQQLARSPSAGGGSHNLAGGVRNKITTTSGWYLNVSSACSATVVPENWKQTSSGTSCNTQGLIFMCCLEGARGRIKPVASKYCCARFCFSSAIISKIIYCKRVWVEYEQYNTKFYIQGSKHHSCLTPEMPLFLPNL